MFVCQVEIQLIRILFIKVKCRMCDYAVRSSPLPSRSRSLSRTAFVVSLSYAISQMLHHTGQGNKNAVPAGWLVG